ncbi:MAG: hypothetical protein KAW46_09075 [candidate division Zixibacteria bacterium]|nr:hypothetical protein [candidate division Zixibacteria bacterium]
MNLTKQFIFAAVVVCIIAIPSSLDATSTRTERQTLEGLKRVLVDVQVLRQGEVSVELNQTAMRRDIQTTLDTLGIRRQGLPEAEKNGNILGLTIAVMNPESEGGMSGFYVYTAELVLRQRVKLVRKRGVRASAITWMASTTGCAIPDELNNSVRRSVATVLEMFAEDYREVNQ